MPAARNSFCKIGKALGVDFPKCFDTTCIELGATLLKIKGVVYADDSKSIGVLLTASRRYQPERAKEYLWYSVHPEQLALMAGYEHRFISLGFGIDGNIFLLPIGEFEKHKDSLSMSPKNKKRKREAYWHLKIYEIDGELRVATRRGLPWISMTSYLKAGC